MARTNEQLEALASIAADIVWNGLPRDAAAASRVAEQDRDVLAYACEIADEIMADKSFAPRSRSELEVDVFDGLYDWQGCCHGPLGS